MLETVEFLVSCSDPDTHNPGVLPTRPIIDASVCNILVALILPPAETSVEPTRGLGVARAQVTESSRGPYPETVL